MRLNLDTVRNELSLSNWERHIYNFHLANIQLLSNPKLLDESEILNASMLQDLCYVISINSYFCSNMPFSCSTAHFPLGHRSPIKRSA